MRIVLFLFLLFSATASQAQIPAVEWTKCIGTNDGEDPTDVLPTADGGFIISGYSAGLENGDLSGHHGTGNAVDFWIVKTDKSGIIQWQRTIGGWDSDDGAFILPTSDGGYMVAGSIASYNCNFIGAKGGFDYWVGKLNSQGDLQWQKRYGGSQEDIVSAFAASSDGGYFLGGHTMSKDGDVTGKHGAQDFWAVKIDASGKMLWQKALGGSQTEMPNNLRATPDGGCVLAGYAESNDGDVTGYHGNNDAWVVKLDNKGALQWQKSLGGSMGEVAGSIVVCKDGGYILAGSTNSSDGDVSGSRLDGDAWIVKLDKTGKISWEKTYGGSTYDMAYSIQQTAEGGYVFAGNSYSNDRDLTCNAGVSDVMVMKIDALGTLQWQKTMGGSGYDQAVEIEALGDGSFVVAAIVQSPDIPGYHTPKAGNTGIGDYWLIKLSAPLNAIPNPIVTIDPASATMCNGGAGTLTANVLYGGVKPFFQWFKNGSPAGTNSPSYSDPTLTTNDQVTCTVTNTDACTSGPLQGTDRVTIKRVNTALPVITIAADNTVACNCVTITITAKVQGAGASPRYKWQINGAEIDFNYPTFISNNLKEGDEIVCTYSDNFTCATNNSILSNKIKIGAAANVKPTVSITATSDTICKEGTAIFAAHPVNAGASPTYQWKINGVAAGTNSAVLTSSSIKDGDVVTCTIQVDPLFPCAAVKTATSNNIVMHVTSQTAPGLSLVATAERICTGSSVTFTATAMNAGTSPNYQWKINGIHAGENTNTFTTSELSDNDVVSCTVDADRRFACAIFNQVVSKSIRITVTDGTPPSVLISADQTGVCPGEPIRFTAVTSNAGQSPVYQWQINGNTLSATNSIVDINTLSNGDEVVCQIIPGAGACTSAPANSNIIAANIYSAPIVSISPADTLVSRGSTVHFNTTLSGDVSSVEWSPANQLMDPLALSPTTTPVTEDRQYKLLVVGSNGCRTEATGVIKISTRLSMPNAFTPNGNGKNDLFIIPPSASLELREFSIYNRWGKRIFVTQDRNHGWDGTIAGLPQETGSYVYMIRYRLNGQELVMKGTVTLVR